MPNLNKKKTIILIVILLLLSLLIVLFFILSGKKKEVYQGEPILLEALPPNDLGEIDVKNLRINEDVYTVWGVSDKVSVSAIEEMIRELGLDLTLENEEEGSHYYWTDNKGNSFQYFLLRNSLVFNVADGIPWNEVTLTNNSFSAFVEKYFDVSWDYELTHTLSFPEGREVFYARRLLEGGIGVEMTPNLYQETDHLILGNGMIFSGEIFLTHFFDTGIRVPLLSSNRLSEYVNSPSYPKIISTRPDDIATVLGLDNDYPDINMEVLELQQSVDNCKATDYSVVYLYESFDQTLLIPTYRLTMECRLMYKGLEYSVPAVGYVNAVDPQYIRTSE